MEGFESLGWHQQDSNGRAESLRWHQREYKTAGNKRYHVSTGEVTTVSVRMAYLATHVIGFSIPEIFQEIKARSRLPGEGLP